MRPKTGKIGNQSEAASAPEPEEGQAPDLRLGAPGGVFGRLRAIKCKFVSGREEGDGKGGMDGWREGGKEGRKEGWTEGGRERERESRGKGGGGKRERAREGERDSFSVVKNVKDEK